MPNFNYRVRDRSGKVLKGVIGAEDKAAAARSLDGMGYIPISVEEAREEPTATGARRSRRVKLNDLNMFTRQLLTLQKAGLPLLMSLTAIERQAKNQTMRDIIKEIASTVEGGSSLSDALETHPRVFNELYVNMVRSGEASGLLDQILERLVSLGEKELDTQNKVKAATRYPTMAMTALVLAFVIVVTFVIPKFAAMFASQGGQLPLPTRILLNISAAFKKYWYLILLLIGGLVVGFKMVTRTKKGRYMWDMVRLKVPVFGPLIQMITMSRFTRITGMLISSGLPIIQVLDMVTRTVDNSVIAEAVTNITESVREGKGIAEPMKVSGLFPPLVIQMVAIGEETGKVDELLTKVADYYDQQSDYTIDNLATLIEPIFILFLGGMILVMALAIFLPIWNMMQLYSR